MARFLRWLRERKKGIKRAAKITVIATAIGIAAFLLNFSKSRIVKYVPFKNDPIVNVFVDSTSKYYEILLSAQTSAQSNDITGIEESIKEIDKINKYVGNALYDNSDLSYLFEKGFFTTRGQLEGAENFRRQILLVRTELAKKEVELKGL